MKRSSYYLSVLLGLISTSNVFGGRVTVKNRTTSAIQVKMETGGYKGNNMMSCPNENFSIQSGQDSIVMIGTSVCPLVKVIARIDSNLTAQVEAWEGKVAEDATFVVKSSGPNFFKVVKE